MATYSPATQALLDLVRYHAPPKAVDWPAAERAAGVRFPSEYREVAEALGPGSFQTFVSFWDPADQSHDRDGLPDDLVVWAEVGFDYTIGWLTEGDDPDKWPVAVCDSGDFDERAVYRMSTAEFLTALLTYPTPIEPLSYVTVAYQPPRFWGNDGTESAAPPALSWVADAEPIQPDDCAGQLRGLVTPFPITVPRWYDVWVGQVQGRLGWPVPEDYQHVIERYGAIKAGPVTVAAPGGPLDLIRSYNRLKRRVTKERADGGGPPGPIWPEEHGALRWADLDDGGHVCWLAVGNDPDRWPVIVLDAALTRAKLHPVSASRFLLEVATQRRSPW